MRSGRVISAVPLDPGPRSALAALVLSVEVSLFGGAAVDADDFERCMTSYRRLEAALGA